MKTRRPTLDEWFMVHQHRRIIREHSRIYGQATVDVTAVVEDWSQRGLRASFPAILTRAAAIAARQHPKVNQLYMRTLWGDRIAAYDGVHVSQPILIDNDGKPALTAVVLKDTDRRTAVELRDELLEQKARGLSGHPLTKLVTTRPNNLFWRTVLRVIHFLVYRCGLYAKHGAAIGVSCTASPRQSWREAHFCGASPTTMFIVLCGIRRPEGRTLLDLAFNGDHNILDGVTTRLFLEAMISALEDRTEEGIEKLR